MIVLHPTYFINELNEEGLSKPQIDNVKNFIIELYVSMAPEWRPGNCRAMDRLVSVAERARGINGCSNFFGKIRTMRYGREHYFWVSDTKKGDFILDPTGVPIKPISKTIVPYFGLADKVPERPEFRKWVYDKREEMDDWGTRNLPPWFTP